MSIFKKFLKKDNSYDDNSNITVQCIKNEIIKDKKKSNNIGTQEQINRRKKIVKKLMTIEYPPQRSKEWFSMRENAITASDAGQSLNLNHYVAQFEFVCKKVFEYKFPDNINCYNGKKYENIATMIYSYRNDVKVEEFGLILHPKYSFLAASPDGIVSKYKMDGKTETKLVGRMLEIKCPTTRKLIHNGIIKGNICPLYYWIQIQNQLECCDLDQCDFLQCKITEYKDREEFIDDTDEDINYKSKKYGLEKGAIIQLIPKETVYKTVSKEKNEDDIETIEINTSEYNKIIWGSAKWIYPPTINMSPSDYDIWITKNVQNISEIYPDYCLDRIYYWKLEDITCDTVEREKDWFAENLDKYKRIWKIVKGFRVNKHRNKILEKYLKTFNFLNDGTFKDNIIKKKNNSKIMKAMEILLESIDSEDELDKDEYNKYLKKIIEKTSKIPHDKDHH